MGKKHLLCQVIKKRRLVTLSGQKKYACNICRKTFNQSCHLKIHQLTHTGEKKYTCDVCGKTFSQSGNLKRHKLTHTNEKKHLPDKVNL